MADPMIVDVPIDQVALLEDRAQVTRRANLEIQEGEAWLKIADVSPILADKTLAAVLEAAGEAGAEAPRITEIRVLRRTLAVTAHRPEEARTLREELQTLYHRQGEIEARSERAELGLAEHDQLADEALEDLAVDAAWNQLDTDAWGSEIGQVVADEAAARQQRLGLQRELRELQRTIDHLEQRIAATERPDDHVAADLELRLRSAQAGPCELRIDYVVPGACWRPYHTATRTPGKDAEVTVVTDGCVWQNTGEDWNDVQLVLSTERPSLGVEPPRLSSDLLRVQRRNEVLQVETRDQEIQTTGQGGATRTEDELPGIDDGGEVLTMSAQRRADVASDGRPVRVPLLHFAAPAEFELVAMPELAEAALLRSVQDNLAGQPLLAGPVDLVRGAGRAGRTSVLYIAAKERFELGWGPDPALRVRREVEVSAEDKGMLSSWITRDHEITIRLSNLGPDERQLTVSERVPVSEIEKVQITVDEKATTGRKTPDDQGIVQWPVTIAGYGRKKITLRYTLKKHSDVQGV